MDIVFILFYFQKEIVMSRAIEKRMEKTSLQTTQIVKGEQVDKGRQCWYRTEWRMGHGNNGGQNEQKEGMALT